MIESLVSQDEKKDEAASPLLAFLRRHGPHVVDGRVRVMRTGGMERMLSCGKTQVQQVGPREQEGGVKRDTRQRGG